MVEHTVDRSCQPHPRTDVFDLSSDFLCIENLRETIMSMLLYIIHTSNGNMC